MRILAYRLPQLQAEVEKFNKKANKWKLPPVEIKIIETKVEERRIAEIDEMTGEQRKIEVEVTYLDIVGEIPRIEGWSIHSKIQPSDVAGQNFVFTTQNHEQDDKLRYRALFCDHCQSSRLKKTGYWIEHVDGRTMMVGATCLRDFLPAVNIERLMAYMDNLPTGFAFDEDEDERGIPRGEWVYDTKQALKDSLRSIEVRGFVSRTKAMDTGDSATASDIDLSPKAKYELYKGADMEALDKKVEACIAYMNAKDEAGNDFIYNVKLSIAQAHVKPKLFGYLAAAAAVYLRETSEALEKGAGELNEWWGTVGARSTFRGLLLTALNVTEGEWGTTYIHRFLDKEGRMFIWFGSKKIGDTGQTYDVKGTIKKHDAFKGRKQTVITRCQLA